MNLLFTIPMEILVVALPPFFTLLGYALHRIFNGPREKLDREKIKVETEAIVFNMVKELKDDFINTIRENKSKIEKLEDDNAECKLLHSLVELELKYMKKHNAFHPIEKQKVFVIDDDPDDLEEFRIIFDKSSVIDYVGFSNEDEALKEANIVQPPCIIIDMNLRRTTADKLIKLLSFPTEIFIVSGQGGYEKRFLDNNKVSFFKKEGHYVFEIAMAAIKYLTDKN